VIYACEIVICSCAHELSYVECVCVCVQMCEFVCMFHASLCALRDSRNVCMYACIFWGMGKCCVCASTLYMHMRIYLKGCLCLCVCVHIYNITALESIFMDVYMQSPYVCMYVCVCVFASYLCMDVCMHKSRSYVCISPHMCVCMHVYMHVTMCVCTYACSNMCVCVCMRATACVCMHVCI
jgi:hypothetical protein